MRSKYGNVKVELDGYKFDSKLEADRYKELRLLQSKNLISDLEVHPKFPLRAGRSDVQVAVYVGDFAYLSHGVGPEPKYVLEDCKGRKTAVYQLKKKMVKACYGIEIQEVTKCVTKLKR